MLPIPNLDDRFYDQIVKEARKAIPKLNPEWTDENVHDPGITFIELFAWLTEMQQYYLNRITHKSELKFLKLLGTKPQPARSAWVDVSFKEIEKEYTMPEGTKLLANDQYFETDQPLLLTPTEIENIIVFSNSESNDYTSSNVHIGAAYFAFGQEAKQGNKLYISFDRPLNIDKDLALTLSLVEKYPVTIGSSNNNKFDIFPSANVSWSYYGSSGDDTNLSDGWFPLEVIKDETAHLSYSGRVTIQVPGEMKPIMIHPANDKQRYWFCCTLEEEGFEISPRIQHISLNTISASHQNTLCHEQLFSSNGEPHQVMTLGHYLNIEGEVDVQVRDDQGAWHFWSEVNILSKCDQEAQCYQLIVDEEHNQLHVLFGDNQNGHIPPQGSKNIRFISYLFDFKNQMYIGQSNGLPNQAFELLGNQEDINILKLSIQVGKKNAETGKIVWEDWSRVDDFDQSNSADCDYMVQPETNHIIFGNNEKGQIPDNIGIPNIRITSLTIGGGEKGNIKNNVLSKIIDSTGKFGQMTATNYFPASAGCEEETLEDAKKRVLVELDQSTRTVTDEDFERIAQSTPGLRVARVKAIPLYVSGMKDYPEQKAHGQITVVIVPYSEKQRPMPSEGFLQTVHKHLDQYRLMTTEIHVIAPEYIKISVYAVIVVELHFKNKEKIINTLNEYLQPLNEQGSQGWSFGRTVYKGDILSEINQISGISYIQDLWLDAEGKEIHKNNNGDIEIPPHGLIYSGKHEISIVSRSDV